jgi:putative transposase
LSADERAQALAVLDSPRFADKSVGQVWATLLDEGVYLCSQATMYRLLRERGQTGERRAQAVRPATRKPELEADGPNQVWSWDITKLKGPARGVTTHRGRSTATPNPEAEHHDPRPDQRSHRRARRSRQSDR